MSTEEIVVVSPSSRENIQSKARRYLVEGRVSVRHVALASAGYATVVAHLRGDSGELYRVTYRPAEGWRCTCPARSRCSHEQAVMLVTVVPRAEL